MISEFNFFRINCWLEDSTDISYGTAIGIAIYEYLISKDNKESSRNDIYHFIKDVLGLKINYDFFINHIDNDPNLLKDPIDNDILVKLNEQSIDNFRERENFHSISFQISRFAELNNIGDELKHEVEEILFKSLYININSFAVNDLKTLISDSIKKEFTIDGIETFNQFLDWDDIKKNKALFSVFEKAIEFAILTSNRGVSSISSDIFKNKTYYLDANVVIRSLGIDGSERQESIISILKSCIHDGIKFSISRITYNEIVTFLNNKVELVKHKTSPANEDLLKPIIDDIPFNHSFETHYINKRKDNTVSSPSNYRLYLEKELSIFLDIFGINIELIKNIPENDINILSKKLLRIKNNDYGKWYYTKGSAIVDAKNILFVRNVRNHNDHNYYDIKSFYLTTDGTLNDIISDLHSDIIPETILPSQLFVIHNSFHKNNEAKDYKEFINFIKIRKTDFKLPGSEVFNYIEQVRNVTSNVVDIKSSFKAYANYRYSFKRENKQDNHEIIPFKDFTESRLERILGESRKSVDQIDSARTEAKKRLRNYFFWAKLTAYSIEILLLSFITILVYIITNKSDVAIYTIIFMIVIFRTIILFTKDKFYINYIIRNFIFFLLYARDPFFRIHKNDSKYIENINQFKNTN